MATYPGYAVPSVKLTSSFGLPNFQSKAVIPAKSSVMAGLPTRGTKTSTQPVDENPVTHAGYKLELYGFLHFYNRIHFQYPILNLGNVLGDQNVQFWIMNAFFTSQSLLDIARIGVDDLGIDPSDADTPIVFAPFQQIYFDLSIPASGPPSVDVTYVFDFGFRTFNLEVFGNRLVLFPFIPQNDITEVLEFSTAIKESDNEYEQRAKLRNPRQRFSYKVNLDDVQAAYMQSLVFDWQHRIFGVPFWPEARFIEQAALEGAVDINVLTDAADFRVGGLAFIYQDKNTYEASAIVSMTSTGIELQSPLVNDYTKALVMPIRDCYAGNNLGRSRYPINLTTGVASFVTLTNVDLSDLTGSVMYDSRVYLGDLNFMDGTKPFDISRSILVIDTKTGTIYQSSKAEHGRVMTSKQWRARNRTELWRIRRLLHYLTGRRSFFMPTNSFDFTLTQDIAPGGTTIRIKNIYYKTFIRNRRPFGDVRVLLKNGAEYVRQIVDSETDGDFEVITVNAQFSASLIPLSSIARCDLVMLVRIADDKAEILHKYAGSAEITANVVSVRA